MYKGTFLEYLVDRMDISTVKEHYAEFSNGGDFIAYVKELAASRDSCILSEAPSADNGLYWKDEYDRAVNEISELQAQLYDAEEEIRGLQNEIKRGIADNAQRLHENR